MHYVTATVVETEQLRPRVRRIRLGGPELAGLPWRAGQQVRVRVDNVAFLSSLVQGKALDQLRTYSVFGFDQARGLLDLCVFQRDDGDSPGLSWSRRVTVGDPVTFVGPEGRLVVAGDAAYHVFVGEETAQLAFAAMLPALPARAGVFGVLDVASAGERLDLTRGDELTWRYRGPAPATDPAGVVDALRRLDLPAGPGAAYVAGEAQSCAAVRRHLIRERGWPRRAVATKPFWSPGKRGLS
jgi:NADPH-dependent ferric siderophore reductase